MCGIVAIVGMNEITPPLLRGLQVLSPRGTDSAGITLLESTGTFVTSKVAGRPALEKLISRLGAGNVTTASAGLGHLRWATQGEVHERNAHPHFDLSQRFAMVHNGNVDHASLEHLRASVGNMTWVSNTDTEVLVASWARLVDAQDARAAKPTAELLQQFLEKIEGTNAFVILDRLFPDTLFVAVQGSAELYLAQTEKGALIVASSPYALMEHADEYVALAPGAYVCCQANSGYEGTRHEIDRGASAPSVNGYDFIMEAELSHVPSAVRRVIDAYEREPLWSRLPDKLRRQAPDEIVFLACGTSLHAAELVAPLFASQLRIPVRAIDATNTIHEPVYLYGEYPLVVALSQSGTTADTLVSLESCLAQVPLEDRVRVCTLGIHNNPMGALAKRVEGSLYTYTGEERATASTMAFFGQCATLWLLLEALRERCVSRGTSSELKSLERALELVNREGDSFRTIASTLLFVPNFKILALGSDVAAAAEGALKFEEVVYVAAQALPAGRLKHGPLALIPDKTFVITLAPKLKGDGARYDRLVGAIKDVVTREGHVLVLTTNTNLDFEESPRSENENGHHPRWPNVQTLHLPETGHPCTQGLVMAYALQRLAFALGVLLGREIDQPRNLAKTVTVQ
ncbi:SIS domain-containing protein [Patescibacteria group bacterium]|nr:SIS domain-containing protein [Patescibacteria group bacterium]